MSLGIGLNKIDILNIEWPNSDRDLHIVTPTLVYLNKKYNISYKTVSIFNGYYYILKYRPKMIFISNFQGAIENNNIVKLAKLCGLQVISCISEGNVKEKALDQFLWGHNTDKKLYVEKMLVWSTRSENIFLDAYPNLRNKIITTGATGFDRYKLLNFKSKEDFLKENNLNFKKIIGIAAWGFDHYFGKYFENNKEYYYNIFGKKQIDMHRKDLDKIQKIYRYIIKNNKDILFILRYHPGTIDFEKNEFFGLEKYENTFISNNFQNNQYKISDLINISDLWIGYETTTALEAWLLKKQTFLINPTRSDFIRENVHKGSPIVKTAVEAQTLIDEYYTNITINAFEILQTERRNIIKNTIEYDDGKNYQRAAAEIMKVFNQEDKKIQFNAKIYFKAVKQIFRLILAKTVFRNRWVSLRYKSDFAKKYQDMYEKVIDV